MRRQYIALFDLIYGSLFCVCFIVNLVPARHFRQVGIGGSRRLEKMCNELKKNLLTMLCLRILWTTGVNTSITTIDRGRSRQCCDTQK